MTSKKHWTLRAAGLLFALVLITSCFVGGTFAKYVTSGYGHESARVAKFGVTMSVATDTAFKQNYSLRLVQKAVTSLYFPSVENLKSL